MLALDLNLLKNLCNICATSGDEGRVREFIKEEIAKFADDVSTDNLGNLIVFKKGQQRSKRKLMLSAHMDEVGFIVNNIDSDGFASFKTVGGILNEAIVCENVYIPQKGINGVIGAKPVHTLSSDEKNTPIKLSELYIDIGTDNLNETKEYIEVGDYATFCPNFYTFRNMIRSKAIDDRVGCAIMITMIKSKLAYDTCFAFNVQEEVGTRGAKTSTYSINPDSCIVIEATTASDLPNVKSENRVCCLNDGAVISFMDRGTIYDRDYFQLAKAVAKENNIKYQVKRGTMGANDSASIHCSRAGVRTIALSLPCRYLHSSTSTANISDANALLNLSLKLAENIAQGRS